MRKILPFLLALIGLCIGGGVGWFLRPAISKVESIEGDSLAAKPGTDSSSGAETGLQEGAGGAASDVAPSEFVKLTNQFIVPIVVEGRVSSMVALSLNLEVTAGSTEATFAVEPKLRDRFLQILFDHANAGGFAGTFTDGANLIVLRRSLLEAAQVVIGASVLDVLISDFGRQDN